MTAPNDTLKIEQKLVVVFDICSSTSILEDLLRSDNEKRWRDLLIEIKTFLMQERVIRQFEIYKFIGDGWILLFDFNFPPEELFSLLKRLCDKYDSAFKRRIRRVLTTEIDSIGITFGLDMGRLIHFVMNEVEEYIGRYLNVAARLQGAIKDGDATPAGKVLMSKPFYDHVRAAISKDYKTYTVKRTLRNVAGGERYRPIKLILREESGKASVLQAKRQK